MHENWSGGIEIEQINIFLLLSADNLAISETPNGLQKHLNTLHTYCEKWGLTVNIDKTKAMIFQKGSNKKGIQNLLHVQQKPEKLSTVFHTLERFYPQMASSIKM